MKPLTWAIKSWAKGEGINGPHETLTGYCWTLLVLNYLQYYHIIPTLPLESHSIDCELPTSSLDQSPDLNRDFERLFHDFFLYYSRIIPLLKLKKISVKYGSLIDWPEELRYFEEFEDSNETNSDRQIFIEDPYDLTNVAQEISLESFRPLDLVTTKISSICNSQIFHARS